MEHVLQTILKQIDHLLRHPHGLLRQHLHLLTLKTQKIEEFIITLKTKTNMSRKLDKLDTKTKKYLLLRYLRYSLAASYARRLLACRSELQRQASECCCSTHGEIWP
jgi:hypothetical protein